MKYTNHLFRTMALLVVVSICTLLFMGCRCNDESPLDPIAVSINAYSPHLGNSIRFVKAEVLTPDQIQLEYTVSPSFFTYVDTEIESLMKDYILEFPMDGAINTALAELKATVVLHFVDYQNADNVYRMVLTNDKIRNHVPSTQADTQKLKLMALNTQMLLPLVLNGDVSLVDVAFVSPGTIRYQYQVSDNVASEKNRAERKERVRQSFVDMLRTSAQGAEIREIGPQIELQFYKADKTSILNITLSPSEYR